jgi:hypothetical protein
LLRTIDPEEIPAAFVALPDEEQRWRGRLYLMVWWASRDKPYSWDAALIQDPAYEHEWRAIVQETPDELLLARVQAAQAEDRPGGGSPRPCSLPISDAIVRQPPTVGSRSRAEISGQ